MHERGGLGSARSDGKGIYVGCHAEQAGKASRDDDEEVSNAVPLCDFGRSQNDGKDPYVAWYG